MPSPLALYSTTVLVMLLSITAATLVCAERRITTLQLEIDHNLTDLDRLRACMVHYQYHYRLHSGNNKPPIGPKMDEDDFYDTYMRIL